MSIYPLAIALIKSLVTYKQTCFSALYHTWTDTIMAIKKYLAALNMEGSSFVAVDMHKHDTHTWNCVSNPVIPVSLSFCFSFSMAPASPEAGIWVSPQVRDSRTASWMNTYWSWVGEWVREVVVQTSSSSMKL